jgi:hypothetical protein
LSPGGWSGVVYQDGSIAGIDRILLAGRRIQLFTPPTALLGSELDDRQVRALGARGNATLRNLTVGIVGLGGLGSPIAETLARMGTGNMLLVDDDALEPTNVRRVFTVTSSDAVARRPKVEAVAEGIRRIGLETELQPIVGDARAAEVQGSLLECDILVTATDTHSSRAALTELAVRADIPMVDVGVRVGLRRTGVLDALLLERRVVVPDGPCLWCWSTLDAHQIRVELMSDFERRALTEQGYVAGAAGEPEPSVAALTVAAAGVAASTVLGLVAGGLEESALAVSLEALRVEAYPFDQSKPDPECVCARWRVR